MAGTKWSQFPAASSVSNNDEIVGLQSGANKRFSVANLIVAVRRGLANLFVPLTRTVNGKALSADITLDASDVSAVPDTREVNGHALSSDITLDASDVGAVDADDVGVAGGVAELDANGKVPTSQLPPIASTAADVTYDNTQSGLTADDVQEALDELAAGGSASGKADQTTIAPIEASTMASSAHPLGSIFYLSGVLYRALADIAIGGTINTGTGGNATQTKVSENFKRTVTLTSAQYAQLSAAEKAADIIYIVTDEVVDYAEQSQLAYVETGTTASRAYRAGEYFCKDGQTCRTKTNIASGASFTLNTNYEVLPGGGFNGLATFIGGVAANGSITLNVPYYAAGFVATARSTTGHRSLAFVTAVDVSVLVASASITYSLSGNTLTISNGTANPVTLYIYNFNPTIPIAVN